VGEGGEGGPTELELRGYSSLGHCLETTANTTGNCWTRGGAYKNTPTSH